LQFIDNQVSIAIDDLTAWRTLSAATVMAVKAFRCGIVAPTEFTNVEMGARIERCRIRRIIPGPKLVRSEGNTSNISDARGEREI
jgi:hypothetical protein